MTWTSSEGNRSNSIHCAEDSCMLGLATSVTRLTYFQQNWTLLVDVSSRVPRSSWRSTDAMLGPEHTQHQIHSEAGSLHGHVWASQRYPWSSWTSSGMPWHLPCQGRGQHPISAQHPMHAASSSCKKNFNREWNSSCYVLISFDIV